MKRSDKTQFIDENFHRIFMTARLIVEEGDATKDEMANYLTQKSNEEFKSVFDAPERVFIMMAFRDLLEGLSDPDIRAMVLEGDDSDEV